MTSNIYRDRKVEGMLMGKKVGAIIILLIIVGCSPAYDEEKGFISSALSDDFPIPENAKKIEGYYYNPNIKEGVSYNLKRIGGNQGLINPERYFEEIIKWGWEEQTDKQLGAVSFFTKEGIEMAVVIKENEFSIYEMKKVSKTDET